MFLGDERVFRSTWHRSTGADVIEGKIMRNVIGVMDEKEIPALRFTTWKIIFYLIFYFIFNRNIFY